jgi:hypothetical protein
MLNNEYYVTRMLAYEGFLRRASQLHLPFMLKGSYVTRQYLANPETRQPADLDWIYLEHLPEAEEAENTFTEWTTAVTELYENDGIEFSSFSKNAFWRLIDYAMADDFPTVNTDIACRVDGEDFHHFNLDISFNLEVGVQPVPLLYKPLRGEPFTVPFTAPLSLQVAWKIHQTLVRPRFKDLFDLIYLVQHPLYDAAALYQSLQALVNECAADKVNLKRLGWLLAGDVGLLFPGYTMIQNWDYWRHGREAHYTQLQDGGTAADITDASVLPAALPVFLEQFTNALNGAGLGVHLMDTLPLPVWKNRKTNKD